jgi:hypothetical protein
MAAQRVHAYRWTQAQEIAWLLKHQHEIRGSAAHALKLLRQHPASYNITRREAEGRRPVLLARCPAS